MTHWFWIGVAISYIGWVICFLEWIIDPYLIRKPVWIQIFGIATLLLLLNVFSIGTVGAHAPLKLQSYIWPEDSSTNTVEGIPWNPKFSDLRIALTNLVSDDYSHVDILINTGWTYDAKIYSGDSFCTLSAVSGAMSIAAMLAKPQENQKLSLTFGKLGNELDLRDSEGSKYITIAKSPGYRLWCTDLPPHETIKMIFAAVQPAQGFEPRGKPGMTIEGISGATSVWDLLSPNASPKTFSMVGKYMRGFKPFHIRFTAQIGRETTLN